MIKFYPIVVTILGFALPGGGTPSVIAALGASRNPLSEGEEGGVSAFEEAVRSFL